MSPTVSGNYLQAAPCAQPNFLEEKYAHVLNFSTPFILTFIMTKLLNIMPKDGMINGTITDLENEILGILRKNKTASISEVAEICKKSPRTISRAIASLKSKKLIERVGSNKAGIWKVK